MIFSQDLYKDVIYLYYLCLIYSVFSHTSSLEILSPEFLRSSPRPISTSQLNTLLHLHSWPINHVVYMGSYPFTVGYLILRRVSRLDAFSVYPVRTWLPSCAIGMTTGALEVRPSRSSRTKDRSFQISCARDR
jgi:hypothetical protein